MVKAIWNILHENVKYAAIEVSSQLGYELNESKKPVNKEDFNLLMNEIVQLKTSYKAS